MNTTPRGAVSAHHPPSPASAQGEHHVAVIGSGPGRPARQCVDNTRRSGAMAGNRGRPGARSGPPRNSELIPDLGHLNWAMTLALDAQFAIDGSDYVCISGGDQA
jgi:hypothetical protein